MVFDGVVLVENIDDVVFIVKLCVEYGVLVIFFGVGSFVEGYVLVFLGGIFFDFLSMNKIFVIYVEDGDVMV